MERSSVLKVTLKEISLPHIEKTTQKLIVICLGMQIKERGEKIVLMKQKSYYDE